MEVPEVEGLSVERLWDLYRMAVEEYRFNVTLGVDRQKFYLGLNLAVSSLVATLGKMDDLPGDGRLASLVLIIAAFTALVGMLAVQRSHEYYRNTHEAGEEPGVRVQALVLWLLGCLLLADIAGAIWLWPT